MLIRITTANNKYNNNKSSEQTGLLSDYVD